MSVKPQAGESPWDEYAERYGENITRLTVMHATDFAGSILSQIRSAKHILDIGCGAGAFGLAYLSYFPRGIRGQTIVFSDLSTSMIQIASQVLMQRVPHDFETKFVFQVEDGTKLEGIQDKSTDLVVSVFGVFLIPDRETTLKSIGRVLKDTGTFGNVSWTLIQNIRQLEKDGFGANMHDAFLSALSPLNDSVDMESPFRNWIDPDFCKDVLSQEGKFNDVVVRRSIHTFTFENADIMWNMLISSSPLGSIKGQDPSRVLEARKVFIDAVAGGNETKAVFTLSASNIMIAHN